jgi:hypothetical protein
LWVLTKGPDATVITGFYTDMMTGKARSYIIRGGNFASFDVPGRLATLTWDMNSSYEVAGVRATPAFGINPQGDVVGAYADAAGVYA